MDKNIQILGDVAKLGMIKKTYPFQIEDEKGFYLLVYENGMVGMVYHALEKDMISPYFHKILTKDYYAYIASDVKYHQAIKSLNQLLNKHEIPHIFLKGSVLKNLYPESYMRAMGDIDILIHDHDLKKVHEIFKHENILLKSRSDAHDMFIMYQEITVEIHPKLYKDFNPKYEVLLSKPWDYATLYEAYEYKFDPVFEITYLLYHLAKHLDSSGIGIRSVLDIAFYVDYYKESIDKEKLINTLKQVELLDFFTHMIKINMIIFGFESLNEFLLSYILSDERYDEIISFIGWSGIHGKGRTFNPFQAQMSSASLKNKNLFIYLFILLFPSYKTMKGMFPWLEKMKILYPLTWILRWFKLFILKGKSTFKKITQLFVKKEDLEKTKAIFKDLGL